MRKILSIAMLFVVGLLHSQHYVLDSITQAHSNLINIEANTLMYAEDSPAFADFFSRLDSIYAGKKDKLHIFHIGGSHIQADIYSNKIRTYLQNMNEVSTSQRGFVFPYHLAHTNNPLNYRVEANKDKWKGYRCSLRDSVAWGLAGVSATFHDKVDTIYIKSNYKNYTKEDYCFNKLRVFYNTWQDDFELTVLDPGLVVADTLDTVATYREFTFVTDLDSIALEVRKKPETATPNPEFLLMGLELMNDAPGIEYTSIGANGAKFKSYTRCAYFEKQLELYHPDLFIISLGTNDAYTRYFNPDRFRAYYEDFIQMVQRVNPDCAILLTVPNDSYYRRKSPNKNTQLQEEIIQELAVKYQMAVWDFYNIMGGYGSSQKWYERDLMPFDRVHFTKLGYSIKADLLLSAIVKQWAQTTNRPEETLLTYFKTLDE